MTTGTSVLAKSAHWGINCVNPLCCSQWTSILDDGDIKLLPDDYSIPGNGVSEDIVNVLMGGGMQQFVSEMAKMR